MGKKEPKRKLKLSTVWSDAREIIWAHRRKVGIGLALLMINRVCVFVLPVSLKRFVEGMETGEGTDLVTRIAFIVIGATLVQSLTGFSLSQILSVTGQRSITEMRTPGLSTSASDLMGEPAGTR